MTPERWRKVEQVYQSTMDREPRLRAAFLAEACGSDRDLRREVDSLLELITRRFWWMRRRGKLWR